MPIYEYECQQCGRRTETMQRMSDPPLETCTSCGGSLKKLLSPPAVQFKGSGWYVTDYARKGQGTKEKGVEDKAEKKAEGTGGKKDPSSTSSSSEGSGGSKKAASE